MTDIHDLVLGDLLKGADFHMDDYDRRPNAVHSYEVLLRDGKRVSITAQSQ